MITCAHCQAEVPASRFCDRCGSHLVNVPIPSYDIAQKAISTLAKIWNSVSMDEREMVLGWVGLAMRESYWAVDRIKEWLNEKSSLDVSRTIGS